jgi:Domain of unknown function (DUF4190)
VTDTSGLPPPPGQGWTGPPPGSYYPTTAAPVGGTSGLAVASLVTGLFFWCFVLPGIVSVILGHLALEQIADSGGVKRGRGMAIAGIVLGWIGIGVLGLGVLIWVISVLTA